MQKRKQAVARQKFLISQNHVNVDQTRMFFTDFFELSFS